MNIRIIAVPPGDAPENIRKDWVGVELPVEDPSNEVGFWHGNKNAGGYIVLKARAVEALKKAGKRRAATFWGSPRFGEHLGFKKEVCAELNE